MNKHYLIEVCLLGPNGYQKEYTCKFLDCSKDGYCCLKLTPFKEAIDLQSILKGDYCKGKNFKDIKI